MFTCDTAAEKSPGRSRGFCRMDQRFRRFVQFQHVIPVDQAVDEGLEIFRPGVAVVDVIGMLPHVDAEDRGCAVNERIFAVGGLGDLELAVLDRDPGPAGTELRGAGIGEIGLELVIAAEVGAEGCFSACPAACCRRRPSSSASRNGCGCSAGAALLKRPALVPKDLLHHLFETDRSAMPASAASLLPLST